MNGEGGFSLRETIVAPVVDLINIAIPILGSLALLFFLISVVRYISKAGDTHGKGDERKAMGWGLVALFVLFSIWGILNIFKQMVPYTNEDPGGGRGNAEVYL